MVQSHLVRPREVISVMFLLAVLLLWLTSALAERSPALVALVCSLGVWVHFVVRSVVPRRHTRARVGGVR